MVNRAVESFSESDVVVAREVASDVATVVASVEICLILFFVFITLLGKHLIRNENSPDRVLGSSPINCNAGFVRRLPIHYIGNGVSGGKTC